jgi:hypothetical protein
MSSILLQVRSDIVRETFENEVVAIDLDRGIYFSIEGVGAWIWHRLEQGVSREALVGAALARYEGAAAEVTAGLETFLGRLQAEGLIVERVEEQVDAATASDGTGEATRVPFSAPALAAFDDMKDLLLLDPIHDMDATGWPARKTEER